MTAELHLLGGAALTGTDGQLVAGAAAQPRRLAVLAVLADACPAPVTRDRLIGLIWPDQDEAGARRLLTQALYALRRELGDFARGSGRDLALDPDALRVDLVEFRRAIAGGDLHRAAGLYRGPLLDGLHVRGTVEFERWLELQREAVRRQFQSAVESLAAAHAAAGEWRDAARWTERLIAEAPFDAAVAVRLVEYWLAAGDRVAALASATAFERRIREGLEIDPDPVVRNRIREALHAAPGGVPAAPRGLDETRPAPPATVSHASPAPAAALLRPGARSRRRWLAIPLAVAAAGMALILARSSTARTETPAIAMLPLTMHGDPALRAAGLAAWEVVGTNLDGAGGIRVAHADTGSNARPWGILAGEIVGAGAQIRLDVELRLGDSTRILGRASAVGPRDSILQVAERVSIDLLPALYPPALERRLGAATLRTARRAAAVRSLLDGEVALRRGAFDQAHEHFRAATRTDSTAVFAWYRRAIAADLAHRAEDAERAIDAASALATGAPEALRLEIEGYRLWRGGDLAGADSTFRALAATDATHHGPWVQLAEVAYHGGPLRGRPIEHARDPWNRAIALDSGDVTALTHGIRLAARARDGDALRALMHRTRRAGATGAPMTEVEVVAAYAVGDRAALDQARRALDTIPEYSLHFLQAVIAGLLERPADAIPVAARMITADRPAALRGQGFIALAHLAIARGGWRDGMRALDSAAIYNPVGAAVTRAWFATLPHVTVPDSVRLAMLDRMRNAPLLGAAAPLYLQIGVSEQAAGVIAPYLRALLSSDLAAGRPCAVNAEAAIRALCADLRIGVAAEAALRDARGADALRLLESMGLEAPYQLAARSPFFARSREHFLRATLLEQAGRLDEAEAWYASATHAAWADYVFLAPAQLGRARIRERRGDAAGAAELYARVLALLPDPDPELAASRLEAERGLARLRRRPPGPV